MRDNDLLGDRGETTEEELEERLRQVKDNSLLGPGAQDFSNYYCETVGITCFDEAEYMIESEQRDSPSWTLGNLSDPSSSDSRRPNLEPKDSLFSRLFRERVENPQSMSTLSTSSTSHESTTEALMEDPSTRT
ncbi:E3 ubiquitin-protein ligase RLIM-like [Heterocephalus glaber]|uniref:E3 ubiquitin-protein ligase RLIM-like n=1 Tax=Heterocephalus glaber TaxID=10181 RepID=A0AAX6T797_HETGA|nr:E3 ubiquitin-protein ligase RLIM-like [Heterocephalus glaber]